MEYTILEQVKIRLKQYHIETVENDAGNTSDVVVFDDKEDNLYIEQLISQAKKEIAILRNYPKSYTPQRIEEDMTQYNDVIVNLAVYDHSQAGDTYMDKYTENGISREWVKRSDLTSRIVPFANGI